MVVVQRAVDVEWTGSIARGSGCASGGSGALGDLPITVASRFGEPDGKTSPEELIAAAHAACFAMALGSIQAAQEAERRCPVSRALQENVAIGVYATLEGPPASSGSAKHEHEGRG
jgi:organic hydroperoxide reductase OsmC/OhrA